MRSLLPLFLTTALITGCGASVRTMDVSQARSYTIASINASPKESAAGLQNAIKDKSGAGAVLFLKKGDRVPVQLRASFGPIALAPGENYVVFSQDTYLYFGPNGIMLSPDGKQWAPISDSAALAKAFGLTQKGTFQFGFGITEDKPASFTIAVEKQ